MLTKPVRSEKQQEWDISACKYAAVSSSSIRCRRPFPGWQRIIASSWERPTTVGSAAKNVISAMRICDWSPEEKNQKSDLENAQKRDFDL